MIHKLLNLFFFITIFSTDLVYCTISLDQRIPIVVQSIYDQLGIDDYKYDSNPIEYSDYSPLWLTEELHFGRAVSQKIYALSRSLTKDEFGDELRNLNDNPLFIGFLNEEDSVIDKVTREFGFVKEAKIIRAAFHDFIFYRLQEQLLLLYEDDHVLKKESKEPKLSRFEAIPLDVCGCDGAPSVRRLILTIQLALAVQKHIPLDQPIMFTAFAAGGLGTEYSIAHILKQLGYKITINLIDHAYPAQLEAGGESYFAQEVAERLSMPLHVYKPGEKLVQGSITLFRSAYDYIDLCKRDSAAKSTILVTIDPAGFPLNRLRKPFGGGVEGFRKPLNVVDIEYDGAHVWIFMPRYSRPRLYWEPEMLNKPAISQQLDTIKKGINRAIKILDPLRISAIEKYRNEFIGFVMHLLPREATPIYFADSHMLFQELVTETLRMNGVAVALDGDIVNVSSDFYQKAGYMSVNEATDANEFLKKPARTLIFDYIRMPK